ncbi:MAG: histidine--tRNA ligase [Chloroflexi bacterium]|jgi:histidyl-tRNA synthetase|nr:histidine--tRNA ligase [Chloroflexota bacterium]MBN86517.1 histidine--tRNA ligase [Dehalococcoidia bacterium]MCH2532128.1 histidine--tRNA ligase [Dehalococcoidia bacterium]HCH36262.1 histidine--tRNA ligase [Dehalococcoidia bacterium]|tara:strand:+ start:615 stop:1868 length:1254 start_codon:yes stop_codon:yes gene_type:complete
MFQSPRGTADILPQEQALWSYVRSKLTYSADLFGYQRIDTPIFEDTALFSRTVGEETDIVQKEMYSFEDRGGQSLTLRPEGTAAVCRAYLQHGLHNLAQPQRLYYLCPMFRYDRPQAGRFRQFNQFGIEAIGESDAIIDLEVIQLAIHSMSNLGLQNMRLVLNNIGDHNDRKNYIDALKEHLATHTSNMGEDDRRRYETNPLRVLDSKELSQETFIDLAPKSADFLGVDAKDHWEELLGYLELMGISYTLDHKLVRGLDYYTRTVFEIHPAVTGAQSAVCAGGRYDGLFEELGGKSTPGIGFAAGIERLILNLQTQTYEGGISAKKPLILCYNGIPAKNDAIKLAETLRSEDQLVLLAPNRSLKSQLRFASGTEANLVLIIGENELREGNITCRDMSRGDQLVIPRSDLLNYLKQNT